MPTRIGTGRALLGRVGVVLLNWSTFTAPNDTSLDAITPEVGGAWTEQNGDWDIQGNQANPTGADPGMFMATVDAGAADMDTRATITMGSGAVGTLILRYLDNNNLWQLAHNSFSDIFYLSEIDGGGGTVRATTAYVSAGGTLTFRALCKATEIKGYIEGTNEIIYGSATFNETETEHGIGLNTTGQTVDDFYIYTN